MGRAKDFYYGVYQFNRARQILVADRMPTIEVAETLARERAKVTRIVHIVVNQVTQTIISRFDGIEHMAITPSPRDLQQPGGTTVGEAIQASRLTEDMERKKNVNKDQQRKRYLRGTRSLCPGHWEDLNAERCTPGYARCQFRPARKSGIPNAYFVDKKISPFYDSRKKKDLGEQKHETGGFTNGSVPGGAETVSPKEGFPGPNGSPGDAGGK